MENRIKPLFAKKFSAPFFLLLLLSSSVPVDAIRPRTVALVSAGTGLAVLGACYAKGWFKPLKKEKKKDSKPAHEEENKKKKFHWNWNNTLSIIGSLGLALCTYWYLWRYTPPGHVSQAEQKVKNAESELNKVSAHPLAAETFHNEKECVDFCDNHYGTADLWLVAAKKELEDLLSRTTTTQEQLKNAQQHIEAAKKETHDEALCHNCNTLETEIDKLDSEFNAIKINLKAAFRVIRKDREYLKQVQIDEERKAMHAQAENARTQERNLRRVAKEASRSRQELHNLTKILSQHNLPDLP